MSKALERRFTTRAIETRAEGDDKAVVLIGYAAIHNVLSEDLGGFRERLLPGCFSRSLQANKDIRALINHETGLSTIGRTTNSTLKLSEDEIGLRVEITLPDTSAGRDIGHLVTNGYINQMSFGFDFVEGGTKVVREQDGQLVQEVSDLSLAEVSVVTFPAYRATAVTARSLGQLQKLVAAPVPVIDEQESRYLKLKYLH